MMLDVQEQPDPTAVRVIGYPPALTAMFASGVTPTQVGRWAALMEARHAFITASTPASFGDDAAGVRLDFEASTTLDQIGVLARSLPPSTTFSDSTVTAVIERGQGGTPATVRIRFGIDGMLLDNNHLGDPNTVYDLPSFTGDVGAVNIYEDLDDGTLTLEVTMATPTDDFEAIRAFVTEVAQRIRTIIANPGFVIGTGPVPNAG